MQVAIDIENAVLVELGLTADFLPQFASAVLISFTHPETGNLIYFNNADVSVVVSGVDDEVGHVVDEPSEEEIATWTEERREQEENNFRIHHHYDIGNQDVYIARHEGAVDAKRAAIYCQFQCEEWFGNDAILSNLAVGTLLCMFYGFRHRAVAVMDAATEIDMYSDREKACGTLASELLADTSLNRPEMRDVMARLFERA
jgi:hypothetical protein